MPRKAKFPKYPSKPHSSGQARVRVPGVTKPFYLGVHGSPESYAVYGKLHSDWAAGRLEPDSSRTTTGPVRLVRDVVTRWLAHAQDRYAHSSELAQYRDLAKALLRLFGRAGVKDFGPRALKALQQAMATGSWRTDAEKAALAKSGRDGRWCRNRVNLMTTRCKTLFRWAESEELVPAGTYATLRTVAGLRPGQHDARETAEVGPVAESTVNATIPHMNPVARAAVELLGLCGARPTELLNLKRGDINQTGEIEIARGVKVQLGPVWAVQVRAHKTAHRGHTRTILFGPRAQAILAPFLDRPADAYLFQPAEGRARQLDDQRTQRKTKVQPSQRCRKKNGAKRKPGRKYNACSLQRAIAYAAAKAEQVARAKALSEGSVVPEGIRLVPHWSPYMLRHMAATKLASDFGPEVARIVLGHRSLAITRVYVLDDLGKAAEAMRQVG